MGCRSRKSVRLLYSRIDPTGYGDDLFAFTGNAIRENAVSLAPLIVMPEPLSAGLHHEYDLGVATTLRVRASGDPEGSTVTGLAGVAPGRKVQLICVAGTLILAHEHDGSSQGQRILSSRGSITLRLNGVAEVEYDGWIHRWRIVSVFT